MEEHGYYRRDDSSDEESTDNTEVGLNFTPDDFDPSDEPYKRDIRNPFKMPDFDYSKVEHMSYQQLPHKDIYNPNMQEEIRMILTSDFLSRKRRHWRLVEMDAKHHDTPIAIPGIVPSTPKVTPLDEFPLLSLILNKYRGKLVLCGGAVVNALIGGAFYKLGCSQDADLFFYGISEAEATEILTDCIGILCSAEKIVGYDVKPTAVDDVFTTQVRIEKGLKYVNVAFSRTQKSNFLSNRFDSSYRIYQFVLRIYPTLDSILGGFDVPMCSFAWDGDKFWGTEIAEWCHVNNILIANLSRRSPSFEYRLVKYCQRFSMNLAFPGLDEKFFDPHMKRVNYSAVRRDIVETLHKNNMAIIDDGRWLDRMEESTSVKCPNLNRISFRRDGRVFMTNARHEGQHNKSPEEMARISDYSHTYVNNGHIRSLNSSACTVGNSDAVIVCHTFTSTPTHSEAVEAFRKMNEKPIVTVLDRTQLMKRYERLAPYSHDGQVIAVRPNHPITTRTLLLSTGFPVYTDLMNINFEVFLDQHNWHAKLAARNLKGLTWMTKNPDIQWTASYQPLHTTPKEYYGEFYRCFEVGIPREVSETILLARLRKDNVFSLLPNDVFKYLMQHVMAMYCYDEYA